MSRSKNISWKLLVLIVLVSSFIFFFEVCAQNKEIKAVRTEQKEEMKTIKSEQKEEMKELKADQKEEKKALQSENKSF